MRRTIVTKTTLSWQTAERVWKEGIFEHHLTNPRTYLLPLIKRLIRLVYERHPELVHDIYLYARMYAAKYHKNYVEQNRYGGYKVDLVKPSNRGEDYEPSEND